MIDVMISTIALTTACSPDPVVLNHVDLSHPRPTFPGGTTGLAKPVRAGPATDCRRYIAWLEEKSFTKR